MRKFRSIFSFLKYQKLECIDVYPITSRFLQQESFRHYKHLGQDFAMPIGTPLRSIEPGTVLKVVDYGKENIGKGVLVQWEDGRTAIYGHMSQTSVHPGDHVDVGSLLGYSGNTGHSLGPHLHFGLKEGGRFIDPSPYTPQIQSMNDPGHLQMLANHPIEHHVEHITQAGYTMADLFKGQMQSYMDFFHTLKLNFIHGLSMVDYTALFQHLAHVCLSLFGG